MKYILFINYISYHIYIYISGGKIYIICMADIEDVNNGKYIFHLIY